jgi:hypothetical protein
MTECMQSEARNLFSKKLVLTAISSFRHNFDYICAILGYYAASKGNTLRTFRDDVSISFSRIKKSLSSWTS